MGGVEGDVVAKAELGRKRVDLVARNALANAAVGIDDSGDAGVGIAQDPAADVVIQVNGKVRGRIAIAFGTPNEALQKAALNDSKIEALLTGKTVVKVIVVPDKLVNIVVK